MTGATIAMTSLGAALALVTSVAFSAAADCNTEAERLIVADARDEHARKLEQIFETQYGCGRLAEFSAKVNKLARAASTSDPCMAKGIREASSATVDKVFTRCASDADEY